MDRQPPVAQRRRLHRSAARNVSAASGPEPRALVLLGPPHRVRRLRRDVHDGPGRRPLHRDHRGSRRARTVERDDGADRRDRPRVPRLRCVHPRTRPLAAAPAPRCSGRSRTDVPVAGECTGSAGRHRREHRTRRRSRRGHPFARRRSRSASRVGDHRCGRHLPGAPQRSRRRPAEPPRGMPRHRPPAHVGGPHVERPTRRHRIRRHDDRRRRAADHELRHQKRCATSAFPPRRDHLRHPRRHRRQARILRSDGQRHAVLRAHRLRLAARRTERAVHRPRRRRVDQRLRRLHRRHATRPRGKSECVHRRRRLGASQPDRGLPATIRRRPNRPARGRHHAHDGLGVDGHRRHRARP
ncbi:Uncharacterised protein [Mycobacteroides abscessus subsp. abscessus]|nr:Uncharacterised protein [Mycobacteroides abscessus subsp. abscessus]